MPVTGLNDESVDRNDGVEIFTDEDGAVLAVNELGVEHDDTNRTEEQQTRSGLRGLITSLLS